MTKLQASEINLTNILAVTISQLNTGAKIL